METSVTFETVASAVALLEPRLAVRPRVGLILGSGLNGLADEIHEPASIPYADIPQLVPSTVAGHSGRFVSGILSGVPVIAMQGRVHLYEGYSPAEITMPVRLMRAAGADVLIVTNAAGGLRDGMQPGDLMAITDHIFLPGLAGFSPLRGPNDERLGVRFPDMSPVYDPALLALLERTACEQQIPLTKGVYAMVAGPSYETPAEIRLLRALGADAVGMSTAPEAVVARHGGMRVLGISLITNVPGTPPSEAEPQATTHQQVLQVGQSAVPRMSCLVQSFLAQLAAGEG
ncbi:MAG: purine-nucleoside phosphorylase [Anaerolineae bacterium]|nr:purine-nucleoside phosphorylase [Chloroflexota bacterium]